MSLQKLFGGSSSKTKTVPVNVYSPEQKALLAQISGQASTGLAGPAPSAPAMSVPQTGQEDTYFNWVNNLSSQTALKNILSGTPGYEVGPEFANKYFEESVRPTMMREYTETALPSLKTAYSGPGYWGSARAGAEARAGSDLAYNLAKSKAELLYGEEKEKRKAIDTAYERVLPGTELMTGTYKEAGEYSRGIAQEKVAENLQRFLMGEEVDGHYSAAYNPNVALALSILGLNPYGLGTESKGSSTGGIIPGVISGVSGLLNLGKA